MTFTAVFAAGLDRLLRRTRKEPGHHDARAAIGMVPAVDVPAMMRRAASEMAREVGDSVPIPDGAFRVLLTGHPDGVELVFLDDEGEDACTTKQSVVFRRDAIEPPEIKEPTAGRYWRCKSVSIGSAMPMFFPKWVSMEFVKRGLSVDIWLREGDAGQLAVAIAKAIERVNRTGRADK